MQEGGAAPVAGATKLYIVLEPALRPSRGQRGAYRGAGQGPCTLAPKNARGIPSSGRSRAKIFREDREENSGTF